MMTAIDPASPLLTIGVTVINELEHTRKCIDSILKYTTGRYEIVICDNGSTDPATLSYLKELSGLAGFTVIRNEQNMGCGPSWNAEIKAAKPETEYVCVVHNDSEVVPEWREMLTSVMTDKIVFVGTERCGNHVSNRYIEGVIDKDRQILAGPIYMIHYPTLVKHQLYMDEQFVPIYFDDGDWQLRFKLAGYELYVVNERFPHTEFTTTCKPRSPSAVGEIVVRNEARISRKFEGTYVSHIPSWDALKMPNELVTWIHATGKRFLLVDRVTHAVHSEADCVAPYRVPAEICAACTSTSCWKKTLPQEELWFVAEHGLPLVPDWEPALRHKVLGRW